MSSSPNTPTPFRTSVGGQALMEGIMMRGPEKICCAVRQPDGTIDLTYDTVHDPLVQQSSACAGRLQYG